MAEEYIEDGFVLLSRKIFSSKTFSSLNAIQKLITIYLILMANHKDNQWWDNHEKKFIEIKRGSFITSIEQIKKKIKDKLVTPKKIRLILSTLEKMEFLAIKTTNKYTLVTILKYDLYQNGDNYKGKQKGKLRASKGQGKGKLRATNKNVKNVKNDNKDIKKERQVSDDKNTEKPKKETDPLEFSFTDKCWYELTDWRIKMFSGRYPKLSINFLLEDVYRRKFLSDPDRYQKEIAIAGGVEKLVWQWLGQDEKYRKRKEAKSNMPETAKEIKND